MRLLHVGLACAELGRIGRAAQLAPTPQTRYEAAPWRNEVSPAVIAMQAVPPAEHGASEAQPPAESAPESPMGLGSPTFMLLMFIPLLVFMYWLPRSQQKKQDAAIAALKKGDRVVTQSGLIGRLLESDSRVVKLELAPGVKVQVLRSSLVGRDADPVGTAKADVKAETEEKK